MKNLFSYKFLKHYFCRITVSSQTMRTVFDLKKKTPNMYILATLRYILEHLVNGQLFLQVLFSLPGFQEDKKLYNLATHKHVHFVNTDN